MINLKRSILIVALTFALSSVAFTQTQKRAIYLSDHSVVAGERSLDGDEDDRPLVELIDIQVARNRIAPGKPFIADEHWLKNLKIRVKNVSGKRMICLALTFGLLEGINQELQPSASWGYKFGFQFGKFYEGKVEVETTSKIFLQPNDEVELTYESLDNFTKQALGKVGEGTFHKAEFLGALVQFEDGEWKDSDLLIRQK
ncbi:MAG TPA: hypothetical protein VF791_09285 [Pyrinomonadaceae bacterium]